MVYDLFFHVCSMNIQFNASHANNEFYLFIFSNTLVFTSLVKHFTRVTYLNSYNFEKKNS